MEPVNIEHSGQTETVSVRFRPKFRLEICFGFGVLAFSIFGNSAETLLSAEIDYFGWKVMLLPKFLPKIRCKKTIFLAKRGCFGRNREFRPKKVFWPKFRFGRNFGFSQGPCFDFAVSAKNLFRLPTNRAVTKLHLGPLVVNLETSSVWMGL